MLASAQPGLAAEETALEELARRPAHPPLCTFVLGALQRWNEVDLSEKVMQQAIAGGFVEP
jgi:hypothetical protein